MTKNHSNQKADAGSDQVLITTVQESIYSNLHHEFNITDGGEFLDDALRMKDQPLCETDSKEDV